MTVTATTDGKRIMVRFPYSYALVQQVKSIPGARPHYIKATDGGKDTFDAWWLPLTMTTCHKLREEFGLDLEVIPILSKWARLEINRTRQLDELRDENTDASAASLDRIEKEAPALFKAMGDRKYQMNGAAFLSTAGQVLLGDDPGLGKTLQALAAIIQTDSKDILVGCRTTAMRSVWENETLRWTETIQPYVCQGTRSEREDVMHQFAHHYDAFEDDVRRMLIINIEMVRSKRVEVCPQGMGAYCWKKDSGECRHHYDSEPDWPFLFDRDWDAIILDESHNLLASTKNIQSKGITQIRFGAVQLRRRLKPGGLALALSGTPFRSKLDKAWGTLNWLRPDVFTSFWRFAETHFGVTKDGWGSVVGKEPLDPELWEQELRPYYLARTKAIAAPDLPPIFYAGTPPDDDPDGYRAIRLDMDPKQAKLYRQMADMAEADIEGGRILANGVLAEMSRLRQFASACGKLGDNRKVHPILPSNKFDWLLNFIAERESAGTKMVVASTFTELINLFAAGLHHEGIPSYVLTGETKQDDRTRLQAQFQDMNNPVKVFLINRKAGGESITLDAADDMIILDPAWISDDDEQLEARIHRVSRIHNVTVWRLVSKGTIEEWMSSITAEQRILLASADPNIIREALHG